MTRKWYQSIVGNGSQWYEDDMPVCPLCNKRINDDQLYLIEGDSPVVHYWCGAKWLKR